MPKGLPESLANVRQSTIAANQAISAEITSLSQSEVGDISPQLGSNIYAAASQLSSLLEQPEFNVGGNYHIEAQGVIDSFLRRTIADVIRTHEYHLSMESLGIETYIQYLDPSGEDTGVSCIVLNFRDPLHEESPDVVLTAYAGRSDGGEGGLNLKPDDLNILYDMRDETGLTEFSDLPAHIMRAMADFVQINPIASVSNDDSELFSLELAEITAQAEQALGIARPTAPAEAGFEEEEKPTDEEPVISQAAPDAAQMSEPELREPSSPSGQTITERTPAPGRPRFLTEDEVAQIVENTLRSQSAGNREQIEQIVRLFGQDLGEMSFGLGSIKGTPVAVTISGEKVILARDKQRKIRVNSMSDQQNSFFISALSRQLRIEESAVEPLLFSIFILRFDPKSARRAASRPSEQTTAEEESHKAIEIRRPINIQLTARVFEGALSSSNPVTQAVKEDPSNAWGNYNKALVEFLGGRMDRDRILHHLIPAMRGFIVAYGNAAINYIQTIGDEIIREAQGIGSETGDPVTIIRDKDRAIDQRFAPLVARYVNQQLGSELVNVSVNDNYGFFTNVTRAVQIYFGKTQRERLSADHGISDESVLKALVEDFIAVHYSHLSSGSISLETAQEIQTRVERLNTRQMIRALSAAYGSVSDAALSKVDREIDIILGITGE